MARITRPLTNNEILKAKPREKDDITDIYVNSFQRMLRDGNFRPEELSAIAFGYTKLLEESNEALTELRNVVNITTLSMTDKERMD